MTQKDKELLLKDLCARLPYEVKFPMMTFDGVIKPYTLYSIGKDGKCYASEGGYYQYIEDIKPYLFPLSSMTEEQRQELESLMEVTIVPAWGKILSPTPKYYDWLDKNHFDYRGLIEKGLVLDATGLNIYEPF